MRIAHNDEYSSQKLPQRIRCVVPMAIVVVHLYLACRQLLLSYCIPYCLLLKVRIIHCTDNTIILSLAVIYHQCFTSHYTNNVGMRLRRGQGGEVATSQCHQNAARHTVAV